MQSINSFLKHKNWKMLLQFDTLVGDSWLDKEFSDSIGSLHLATRSHDLMIFVGILKKPAQEQFRARINNGYSLEKQKRNCED